MFLLTKQFFFVSEFWNTMYNQLYSIQATQNPGYRIATFIHVLSLGQPKLAFLLLSILLGLHSTTEQRKYPKNLMYFFNHKAWMPQHAWIFYTNQFTTRNNN